MVLFCNVKILGTNSFFLLLCLLNVWPLLRFTFGSLVLIGWTSSAMLEVTMTGVYWAVKNMTILNTFAPN